ncbi:UDP-glycosyltransferase UGT5-like isoform X1 [Neodiprion pinetum]|uniref:UDP-glycosyltransferase UGT5-like isoform X1 n=2 Tax=Neodiprion pinetum TaxID=441929 RepID=UPI001EE095D2|nr:UDP-glycosyltransferase UGT5-like isoform X1 [Neodiprion pinetum]
MYKNSSMHLLAACVLLSLAGQEVLGARILGLFPVAIKSHLAVTSPLMHALAKKGHDVTMFVPFNTGFNASNYREISWNAVPMTNQMNVLDYARVNILLKPFGFFFMGISTTEAILETPEAKALWESDEKFDIIVTEHFVNDALFAYVHKFKCPVVLISTFGTTSTINSIFGNPAPWSYVPSEFLLFSDRMTFAQRLQNTLVYIYGELVRKFFYIPRQQALVEKYLSGPDEKIPPLDEISRSADFILINSHPAFSTPRSYMPNMKNVAGMHLKPAKPLSVDLQRYFDSSKNGVILFSLGSAMKSVHIPEKPLRALQGAFQRLPYDVLWKWENDTMTNKPTNVRIGKWLPQNDILTHPNLKLFLTHGGISSMMETVYHGVPIVGIPILGDQQRNLICAREKGFSEMMELMEMTEDEIYENIMKVANDPKYRENVKKVSAYWKDEMNNPLDEAVHWVEYVVRHGGGKHLKSVATEQSFVQYFLLDVVFTIMVLLILGFILIRAACRLLVCRRSSPTKSSKKDQLVTRKAQKKTN